VPKAPLPRACELPCDTYDSDSDADSGEQDGPRQEELAGGTAAQLLLQEEESVPWVPLSQRQAPRAFAARPVGFLERTSGEDSGAHASAGGLLARSCDDDASAARSLLPRTCEDSPDTVRALDRLNDSGTVGLDGDGEEEDEDDEEYMDSEEENELLGCRLPPGELAASLKAVMAERRANESFETEEEGPEENPTKKSPGFVAPGESREALKQRTMMLSDQELFQAIADHAPELYHKREQQEDRSSDGDESSTEDVIEQSPGLTDHEEAEIDLLPGGGAAAQVYPKRRPTPCTLHPDLLPDCRAGISRNATR